MAGDGRILVGVDGSAGSAQALAWAVSEARVRGWTVRALMAWGWLDQHHTVLGETFDPSYSDDEARATLEDYVRLAVGAEAARSVEVRVVTDLPAPALIEASGSAELLVVGARGLGGFRGLLLGSVSQRCLQRAHCPVAVVRSGQHLTSWGRVVVGVDRSPEALAALTWAVAEARAREAVLEVVHAWQPPFVGGYPMTAINDPSIYEAAAAEIVADALLQVDVDGLAHPVERTTVDSGPATALLDASERADLVVVGAHGRGRLHAAVLGSVSHQVAVHAAGAVVVVRDQPPG